MPESVKTLLDVGCSWRDPILVAAALFRGLHRISSPIIIHILTELTVFVMFVGLMAVMLFVMPKYQARNPQGSLRLSFILLGLAGILFLAGLCIDLLR
jgi:hypothetical protein